MVRAMSHKCTAHIEDVPVLLSFPGCIVDTRQEGTIHLATMPMYRKQLIDKFGSMKS